MSRILTICSALVCLGLKINVANASILTEDNTELAAKLTKANIELAQKVLEININGNVEQDLLGGYCALGKQRVNIKDMARLAFGRRYIRPKVDSDEEKIALQKRIESALASRFADLFLVEIVPALNRFFDWENSEVEYVKFKRERSKVPGYQVKVTAYLVSADDKGNRLLLDPYKLVFVYAQDENDSNSLKLADMIFNSFRVSAYFEAANDQIKNKRTTLEKTLKSWHSDYPSCPKDLSPYLASLDEGGAALASVQD